MLKARIRALLRRRFFEAGNQRILKEITDRELRAQKALLEKEAAESRAALADQLEQTNRELEEFVSVAAHDLKSPLRTIGSLAQLVARRSDALDERSTADLERVVGTVKHMGRLIEDLLDYARLKASKESVSVRLDEVVDSALQNLACELERAGARVVRDPLPAVRGDATDLVRLFQNLVSNAVKFHAEDPPRIHLGFEEVDGEQRFCVRDNGIGIDPAQHERVFAPFKRLARDLTGTGIGLAACRRIVERTGGRIWIDSSPGRGTEVRFTLAPRGGGADRGPEDRSR